MRKPLRFHELDEQAKTNAAEEVFSREFPTEDWQLLSEMITEYLEEILREHRLEFGSIPWNTRYGATIELNSVTTSRSYYESILTKEQLKLMDELEHFSYYGLDHRVFDGSEEQNFVLEGGYEVNDATESFEFIEEYGNEDEKNDVAFLSLFADELNESQQEQLEEVFIPLAERLEEELATIICDKLDGVEKELTDHITAAVDYYESEKYYYDSLEAQETYLEDKYRFNEQGDIVAVDEELESEYEEEYAEYLATQEAA